MPEPLDLPVEAAQSVVVAGDAVVIDMPDHDAAQPGMLIRYGLVPSPTACFLDSGEARPLFLAARLALNVGFGRGFPRPILRFPRF